MAMNMVPNDPMLYIIDQTALGVITQWWRMVSGSPEGPIPAGWVAEALLSEGRGGQGHNCGGITPHSNSVCRTFSTRACQCKLACQFPTNM
eukprot:scaffold21125_cov16-Tisochrysis_lutea.AAC.1